MECKFIKQGIRINEDGSIVPCCAFKGNIEEFYSNSFSFEDYLNSNKLKNIEENFLNNVWPDQCRYCHREEELKHVSLRQKSQVEIKDGLLLDLVIGKECNSDCVMCHSGQSSKIESRLKRNKPNFTVPSEDLYWITNTTKENNWANDEHFWNQLTLNFHKIEAIKFLGGEPLLNKNLWKWLENKEVLKYKHNKNLSVITNGSVINNTKLHLFEGWKNTNLVLSIDATDNQYEWVRHGLKWETIEYNLYEFKKLKNVCISVHATISFYTVTTIYDLLKWIEDNELLFTFSPIVSPSLLSVNYAPKSILEETLNNLSKIKFKKIQNNMQLRGLKNHVRYALDNNNENVELRKQITTYFNNHRNYKMDWETLRCLT